MKKMLLRRCDVLQLLGIDPKTFQKIVDAGVLMPVFLHPNARAMYRRSDIEKLIENGCQQ